MKPTCNVYIGTSGWHYAHWKGPFYPEHLSTSEMFSHYSRQFKAVEVNNSFCMYDLAGRRSPKRVTADFIYIRLHGPGKSYEGQYDTSTLTGWAGAMYAWLNQDKETFCFFDNDQNGYAAQDALRLQKMMKC